MIYRSHIEEVLAITKEQPVHWAGEPYRFITEVGFGPLTFEETILATAPLLAYQIPYYITKGNGHIMQFDTSLQVQRYYLAHDTFLTKGKKRKVLYRFPDKWMRKDVVLFLTE